MEERVRTLTVAEDEAELRLDRWFRRHFPTLAHGRLEKLLRTGQVRVDGARAKASHRLAAGQAIRVPPLGEAPERPAPKPAARPPSEADAAWVQSLVLHKDDHVIAVNKPAGLATQGGTGTTRHLDALLGRVALRRGGAAAPRPPARPRHVRRAAPRALRPRRRRPRPRLPGARDAEDILGHRRRRAPARARPYRPRPREAWRAEGRAGRGGCGGGAPRRHRLRGVIERAGKRAAWLALRPQTGRTHQLRVHCAALGTPILGDGKYGGKAAEIPGVAEARRLHLHAREIVIAHPAGGRLAVIAPLPDFMRETWRFFGFETPTRATRSPTAPPPP